MVQIDVDGFSGGIEITVGVDLLFGNNFLMVEMMEEEDLLLSCMDLNGNINFIYIFKKQGCHVKFPVLAAVTRKFLNAPVNPAPTVQFNGWTRQATYSLGFIQHIPNHLCVQKIGNATPGKRSTRATRSSTASFFSFAINLLSFFLSPA